MSSASWLGGRDVQVTLTVNGSTRSADVDSASSLLELLRTGLGLTGTKRGCGNGECGACTVLLDGEPVNACLVFAAQCGGRDVLTIEGLSESGELDRIQSAFAENGAVQCGFCTPGMIMSGKALLSKNADPTREEISEAISGNLCRCTGYVKIVDALEAVAKEGDT
ncbi:(2Fe-2S)-binding protein [bacterium]|nr:(2Fe-2S)-binding protein [bacterium]